MNLLRLLDDLESTADAYLTLAEAERATGHDLSQLVADGILLIDYRQRLTPAGAPEPVTLCRLNRHHPSVKQLSRWQ